MTNKKEDTKYYVTDQNNNAPITSDKDDGHRSTKHKLTRRKSKVLIDVLFYTVNLLILLGAVLFSFSNKPDKSLLGFRVYNVLSNSMHSQDGNYQDGFSKDDVIVVKRIPPEQIQVGDVITFMVGNDANAYLTHRVAEIKANLNGKDGLFFVTKGDTNNVYDPPISAEQYIGKKIFKIPYAGLTLTFIQRNLVLVIAFVASWLGFIYLLRLILLDRKRKRLNDKSSTANY